MATKKTNTETVEIRPLDIKRVPIRIVGDTPLIIHAWSEKAKRMMLEAQMGKAKGKKKDVKDPFQDFAQALYWITEKPEDLDEESFDEALANGAKFGFPVGSIKLAGNSAAYRMGWVKNQMALRGAYFLNSEYGDLAEIKGSQPMMREDMVKVGMGTADIRYRPIFEHWYMDVELEYNASGEIGLDNIINIINAGGYCCGLGEWRPEKDGKFGKFHVESL